MSSIYTGSWRDLYDYRRCPKILAAKAYMILRLTRIGSSGGPSRPRQMQMGRAMASLIIEGLSEDVNPNESPITEQAIEAAGTAIVEFSGKTAKTFQKLVQDHGEIELLGKVDGKHAMLSEFVMPHLIARLEKSENPFIIEIKAGQKPDLLDIRQAEFYNALAVNDGVYVLKKRRENGCLEFSPKLVKDDIETVILCPASESYFTVRDKIDFDSKLVREMWRVKQLGFRGMWPHTDCDNDCPHRKMQRKYGLRLQEGDTEPSSPLPLIFARGIEDLGYDLDLNYQVSYAWEMLRTQFRQLRPTPAAIDDMAVRVGLNSTAVQIVLQGWGGKFSCQPTGAELVRACADDLEPWKKIMGKRANGPDIICGSEILRLALQIYALPNGSSGIIDDSWTKWS